MADRRGSGRLVYPAPTLVVGVGRMGLAVLERLGEDWYDLDRANVDASLANLRLVHVADGDEEEAWQLRERETAAVADYVGDSDLPSLALDLAILRSLGLVRFRDGGYQVAVPKDAGVVDNESRLAERQRLERRRFFAWQDLSPDPLVAAERLRRLAGRHSDLDLFVTPILNRVRQGHSPRTLLACVARATALQQGRDPTPWPWVRHLCDAMGTEAGEDGWLRLDVASDGDGAALLGLDEGSSERDHLEEHAPAPLPGWSEWRRALDETRDAELLSLRVPAPFVPGEHDLKAWLDPRKFLELDWQTTGWVTDLTESSGRPPFRIVAASPFRLGLFDHDGSPRSVPRDVFEQRLGRLGTLLHQGLVRLWVDLQRERVEEKWLVLDDRRREHDEDALRQSLEILGELLVRPLSQGQEGAPEPRRKPADDPPLPASPSKFIEAVTFDRQGTDGKRAVDLLSRRLEALGLSESTGRQHRRLLSSLRLRADAERNIAGLGELRRRLNYEVRELFDFTTLAAYRTWPTRRPPRLTVILVGDMGEAFARATMRTLLREIHSELLRAFGPILEYFREGFDRGLSVVPILWTPHPADPFEGKGDDSCRCEEAAIINAIHGVRRWVESVIPSTRRRVSQIFVNSRVTDVAVLAIQDAVRQTRDFITLLVRNDPARDDWMRRLAEGPPGDDLFSSFTCYEIDFPAEKAREYLANRLGRDCLQRLKTKQIDELPEPPTELLAPPRLGDDVAAARRRLVATVEPAAERLAGSVERRVPLTLDTTLPTIETGFAEDFENQLLARIGEEWERLSHDWGEMDELVDRLRESSSRLLTRRVAEVRRHGDRLIERYAADGGVQAAIASFQRFAKQSNEALRDRDGERRKREAVARNHSVPSTGAVRTARRAVLDAARRRPDPRPIALGLVLWGLLVPVLGAALAHGIAYYFELHLEPNAFEPLLGPWGWASGGLLLFAAGWWGVRSFQLRRHRRFTAAVAGLAETVRRILQGDGQTPENETTSSIRSFLESRLLLAEALTARGFTLHVFERVQADRRLAERLNRSIDIQATLLAQHAEDLGVRPTLAAGPEGALAQYPEHDDVRRLFATRSGELIERLIDPQRLVEIYRSRTGQAGEDIDMILSQMLAEAGGFAEWRESACLADSAAVLAVGQREFSDLVDRPLPAQHRLGQEVGERLCRFVARHYPNMGFGARFTGYEGLDPDGVYVRADASLLLHQELAAVYERARKQPTAPATTSTMQVLTRSLRRSAAYMLSLAQGIRAHSVRNLKRFESFHGREHLPEDRTFPISEDMEGPSLNLLTSYGDLAREIDRRFRNLGAPPAGEHQDG